VIGPRAYGADAASVSIAIGAVLAGLRAARVASCLKHFPGHGDTSLDSHLALPRCDAPLDLLETRELPPFRDHLDAPAIMTAHVIYPALDPEQPATFSRAVVTGLLRERLGYAGIVTTDALEMKGATQSGGAAEVGRLALSAGCDLLLYAFHHEDVRRARLELARQLVDGSLDHARFDEARARLAAFDRLRPEPTPGELERPLETLTPPDWEERLLAIAERGLIVRGSLPGAARTGGWRVREPEEIASHSLRDALSALGVATGDASASLDVIALRSRTPLPDPDLEELRARARAGPVALVGLQNDTFLDRVPEAAVRVSASDATPLTIRAVARSLVALRSAAAAV
jgi:beta-glucosidase-like glycosyl hydrolase